MNMFRKNNNKIVCNKEINNKEDSTSNSTNVVAANT